MMFCLRGVPLYRSCDLRTARAKAYQEYCDKILNQKTSENFNFADAPDFTVPDVAVKVAEHKGNAREVIDGTAKSAPRKFKEALKASFFDGESLSAPIGQNPAGV